MRIVPEAHMPLGTQKPHCQPLTAGLLLVKMLVEANTSTPDMTNITAIRTLGPSPGKTGLKARLYPNGEVAIWKESTYVPRPVERPQDRPEDSLNMSLFRLYIECPQVLEGMALALGLSPLPNFDKLVNPDIAPDTAEDGPVTQYGLRGITSYGARRVRNAAHILERTLPKMCAVFATCTVPSLPIEDLRRIHQNWHKVVEAYRRKLARRLRDNDLSGDSVTVTEVQTKRYEKTGLPILHIHTVFGGRRSDGRPAISTKAHDDMWRESLSIALGDAVPECRYACNLQWVKKSAEGYIGKYMTKGTKVVAELCKAGFEGWLPKQWWNLSVGLAKRIDAETRSVDDLAEWLNDVAEIEGSDVWLWHRDIQIEMMSGDKITIARYGRLSIRQTAQIQSLFDSA